MKQKIALLSVVTGLALAGPAVSAPIGPVGDVLNQTAPSPVIKVHSSQKAHDMLHAEGYHRVVLIDQRTDYDGRSSYVFSACDGDKRFRLRVNWYGEVVSRRRAGWCEDDD